MRVKICGITRAEDALLACELGAWAIGFIAYPKSPRFIEAQTVAEIVKQLPEQVLKVGVFVNESTEHVQHYAQQAGLTHVQLHGHEPPEMLEQLSFPVFKAFRLETPADLENLKPYAQAKAFLIDAPTQAWGGSGHQANWDLAKQVKHQGKLILAGGLKAENIVAAITHTQPWAVDLSSGVESAPGIKDPQKLKDLFERTHP